jgi:hypothetical protein
MRGWAVVVALLLAPVLARAEDRPSASGSAADATFGWGYYELLHVGAAIHLGERSTLGVLVGSNLGTNGKTDWTAGFNYAHAVGPPVWETQLGWKVEALFWSQSDADYHWRLLSLLLGVTAVRPITPALSIGLDLSGVFTYTLASDRQQDATFSDPQAWNVSVCVELKYRLASW